MPGHAARIPFGYFPGEYSRGILPVGTGFAAAAMFASVQLRHPLVAPAAPCYVITVAGIAVSLGIIAATFPLLARITGPEVARNE